MYIVTGAAGFIGSNLLQALNRQGVDEILAVDNLERAEKMPNLRDADIADYCDKKEFLSQLQQGKLGGNIEAVFHQGACSDTMESNGRYMMDNNYHYSQAVLHFCLNRNIPLIYASSAAVYGLVPSFKEEKAYEKPLNVYGYSKLLFDRYVERLKVRTPVIGLRYFNVYGPRESHKARMASTAWHFFRQAKADNTMRLFSASGGYDDGEQRRDFISVEDVVNINLHFLNRPVSGVYNVGTGIARSFNDMAHAVNLGLHTEAGIQYIDFPAALAGKYQHYTQADTTRLREQGGYAEPMLSLEQGVSHYMQWLEQHSEYQ